MPLPPGHSVPVGVDPAAQDSVLKWTQSFGSAFSAVLARKRVAERLVSAGYVDLYSLSVGVGDLVSLGGGDDDSQETEQLLQSEARRLAVAARAVCLSLGVPPHAEADVVATQVVQAQAPLRDRGDCPAMQECIYPSTWTRVVSPA